MSASNWTTCPECVKKSKKLRDEFVKKYYGKLDSFVYNKIFEEVNKAVEYMDSDSSKEYKPNSEILQLAQDKNIEVEHDSDSYDYAEILQQGSVSCCLREDYEQGVNDDGFVYMFYSCSCSDCGFDKDIKFEESTHNIRERGQLK